MVTKMNDETLKLKIDTQKIVLSSQTRLYKTESFAKKTKFFSNADFFVSKLAEGLIKNMDALVSSLDAQNGSLVDCFLIQADDFSFLFKLGFQLKSLEHLALGSRDIIFFDAPKSFDELRENDQRLNDYLKLHSIINATVTKTKSLVKQEEFEKLYLVSNSSGVNLPKLTKEQLDIVETMNQNVLVQGVAGSGKTNICIDKIIFTSCQNYSGRVLYSTYSRGLLVDTHEKINSFVADLVEFENCHKKNNVIFLDDDHKHALENKFGVFFFANDDDKIFDKIHHIIDFLQNKVDYLLIEDMYRAKFSSDKSFADERYFVNNFVKTNKNHQVSKAFKKIEKYSYEVIYKEIFGMILGTYSQDQKNQEMLSEQEYVDKRAESFSREDCKVIYQIAKEYESFLQSNNMLDLNSASRQLLENAGTFEEYSLAVLDEVQDFSQVSLNLFKKISLKLFCAGDALQMINPSFFSFGYLKNLLFLKDETAVKQLKANFRNTKKIEQVINSLGEINKSQFGTHNFVVEGTSVDSGLKTTAVCIFDDSFAREIADSHFDNFTFVVSTLARKQQLKTFVRNQEVLTVSEIKGLERSTVVAYDLLSDNFDKWQTLAQNKVNHKEADENSVYRYYYNLFYVGLTRAKQNLFVVESKHIPLFNQFFRQNFEEQNVEGGIKLLGDIVSKVEFTTNEILERIKEFVRLGQFDNAVWTANKIKDDVLRRRQLNIIDVSEKFINDGRHRDAGIRFWELNMPEEARVQFILSGDVELTNLLDACSGNTDEDGLNVNVVDYYDLVSQNDVARKVILQTVDKDRESLKSTFKNIKENFKKVGD